MKIVVDRVIPFVQGVFEPYADSVVYLKGEDIRHEDILDADALVIRTRTRCDAAMLEGTRVRVIATAAISTDNIDMDYCSRQGIFVNNATGSNAGGVMNYVMSALYGVASRKSLHLEGSTFGIIGAGNVGKRVETAAKDLGFKVLLYDPPRAEAEGHYDFCSLEYLLENSNIVTMHLPVNANTRGMADENFFARMRPGAIFINAANGELVVERALKAAIPKLGAVILDTWNNEPDVDRVLVSMVDIATPHIAGYSHQGKQRSSAAAVRTIARYYGITPLLDFFPPAEVNEQEAVRLDVRGKSQGQVASLFQYNYPIFIDDFMFRVDPGNFAALRENYSYRREFLLD